MINGLHLYNTLVSCHLKHVSHFPICSHIHTLIGSWSGLTHQEHQLGVQSLDKQHFDISQENWIFNPMFAGQLHYLRAPADIQYTPSNKTTTKMSYPS